jgi:hypothetical protein
MRLDRIAGNILMFVVPDLRPRFSYCRSRV